MGHLPVLHYDVLPYENKQWKNQNSSSFMDFIFSCRPNMVAQSINPLANHSWILRSHIDFTSNAFFSINFTECENQKKVIEFHFDVSFHCINIAKCPIPL